MSSKVISLTNIKGGVGKSTLAWYIALWLFREGKKVLLIETDFNNPTCSEWYDQISNQDQVFDIYSLDEHGHLGTVLKKLIGKYDYIIIDGAAGKGEAFADMIIYSDLVIIPMDPSQAALARTIDTAKLINSYNKYNPSKPTKKACLLNMVVHNRTIAYKRIELKIRPLQETYGLDQLLKKHTSEPFIQWLQSFKNYTEIGTIFDSRDKKAKEQIQRLVNEIKDIIL